jgi:hypothetical protein
MSNVILNEWISMEPDQVIPESVKMISVDTRDFHWFLSEEMPREKVPDYPVCWSTTDPEHIYFLINELQVHCKDKKWNFLETKNGGYWDLKYIWFKREDDGRFSVWTRNWGTTLNTSHGLASLVNWERNED